MPKDKDFLDNQEATDYNGFDVQQNWINRQISYAQKLSLSKKKQEEAIVYNY